MMFYGYQSSVVGTVFICCVMVGLGQESVSLKQLARKQGGTATVTVTSEFPLLPLDELAARSDFVVRARIERATARLSDDETLVLTSYAVRPVEIIKQPSRVGSVATPGTIPALQIEVVGGDLSVDGLVLRTQSDMYDKAVRLEVGSEYVFFLEPAPPSRISGHLRPGVFVPLSGVFGIFPILEGKLTNFTPWVNARRALPTNDPAGFARIVRAAANKRKQ